MHQAFNIPVSPPTVSVIVKIQAPFAISPLNTLRDSGNVGLYLPVKGAVLHPVEPIAHKPESFIIV